MDNSVPRHPRREVAGRAVLAAAAAVAAAASVAELAGLPGVEDDVAMLAGWRAMGLAVFAGVFALTAWRPRTYPGLLELAIGHKLAMTVYAISHLATAEDAATVATADGVLTIALVAAYVLVGAHRAWPRTRPATAPTGAAQQDRIDETRPV